MCKWCIVKVMLYFLHKNNNHDNNNNWTEWLRIVCREIIIIIIIELDLKICLPACYIFWMDGWIGLVKIDVVFRLLVLLLMVVYCCFLCCFGVRQQIYIVISLKCVFVWYSFPGDDYYYFLTWTWRWKDQDVTYVVFTLLTEVSKMKMYSI